ncbi:MULTISPECIES: ParB/RepB/Spo0J family partition protein [Reichenbachiella]|uniref:Chromosome partitioning protein, ParB family n=1 Tax=Reichenbachiella agariperforans TaxID=156994 RepID=A0A1M6J7P5_REIAG|nr:MULTISPECIES: ParB/RepB/Spo0J family partition protein [Reichenbachiella]RJE74905.1 chromosome partitioning protein ParB [Reichenbachiella sp. MSK19-1]SHJ42657.1 chromosome partitioning protein, ParB family [Reichenbachiella agariperforans]
MAGKKPTRRNALGRGLGALLDDSSNSKEAGIVEEPRERKPLRERSAAVGSISEVQLDQIEVNPYQPRTDFDKEALEELAESIKVQGIIQPITLRKLNNNSFQLISGERRFQASKLVGLKKVPAYIRTADDQQMLEMALIENIQRQDLNAMEVALSYQRLLTDCSLKQEELGDRVGKKRSTVNNYLRLLKLPPDIQAAVRDGKISMGHARALISVEDSVFQLDLLKKILAEDLSVRKVEALVKQASFPDEPEEKIENKEPSKEIIKVQDQLSSHFGTKIKISANDKNKGEIKIPFTSVTELNRILEIIDA